MIYNSKLNLHNWQKTTPLSHLLLLYYFTSHLCSSNICTSEIRSVSAFSNSTTTHNRLNTSYETQMIDQCSKTVSILFLYVAIVNQCHKHACTTRTHMTHVSYQPVKNLQYSVSSLQIFGAKYKMQKCEMRKSENEKYHQQTITLT